MPVRFSELLRVMPAVALCFVMVVASERSPAAATDEMSVKVTLSVEEAEACLLVGVDWLDLGTAGFGSTVASDTYTIVNCSDSAQDLAARATDATGLGDDPITWTLGRSPGIDQFSVDARVTWDGELDGIRRLLASDAATVLVRSMPDEVSVRHLLRMPAPGSVGAGATVAFEIAWTAMLRD